MGLKSFGRIIGWLMDLSDLMLSSESKEPLERLSKRLRTRGDDLDAFVAVTGNSSSSMNSPEL